MTMQLHFYQFGRSRANGHTLTHTEDDHALD